MSSVIIWEGVQSDGFPQRVNAKSIAAKLVLQQIELLSSISLVIFEL